MASESFAPDRLAPHGMTFFTAALSNYVDYGVVLLYVRGRVVLANCAAVKFASQYDGLHVTADGHSATSEAQRGALRRAIAAMLGVGPGMSRSIALRIIPLHERRGAIRRRP